MIFLTFNHFNQLAELQCNRTSSHTHKLAKCSIIIAFAVASNICGPIRVELNNNNSKNSLEFFIVVDVVGIDEQMFSEKKTKQQQLKSNINE